jgi:hypothetical protein
MRQNPGPPTSVLWKTAVFRLSKATGAIGYRFKIEDFANSTFNCLAVLPGDKRSSCAGATKSLADEDRQAGMEQFALAGDLAWTILQLVNLELSSQHSVRPLLELVEARFRGAARSIVDVRQAYERTHSPSKQIRVRFQWSTWIEREQRADIFIDITVTPDGIVHVTTDEIPSFLANFASLDEAKVGLPSVLSRHLEQQMGGPAIIWTPKDWRWLAPRNAS